MPDGRDTAEDYPRLCPVVHHWRGMSSAQPAPPPGRMEAVMGRVMADPVAWLEQKAAARTEDAVKIYG